MKWTRFSLLLATAVWAVPSNAKLDFTTVREQRKTLSRVKERRAQKVETVEFPALDSRSNAQLVESVQSFTVLLKSAGPNSREKNLMRINRASAYVAIAQKFLKSASASQAKANRYLQLADKDSLSSLVELNEKKGNNDLKSRAQFLLGLSNLYQGRMSKAADHFQVAESLDPQASWVSLVNLLVAEQRFIDRRYVEALEIYEKIARTEDPAHRLMAFYREAWCYYNLGKIDLAISSFKKALQLARTEKSSLSKEIAADMLHVTLKNKDAKSFVALSKDIREEEVPENERIGAAIDNYREKRDATSLAYLWSRYKDPKDLDRANRVDLLTAFIAAYAGPFATLNYSKSARWVVGTLEKMEYRYDPKASEDKYLEEEIRLYIKAVVDTFSGQIKSGDAKYGRAHMESDLLWSLQAYGKHFAQTKYFPRVLELGQEACIELNNIPCLETYLVAKDTSQENRERVFKKIWKSLEDRKNPRQVTLFLDKYQTTPKTLKLRQEAQLRAIELSMADKQWDLSEEHITKSLRDFPDDVRFVQQKAHLYFKQEKFDQVIADPDIETVAAKDKNVLEIYEQSAIRILDKNLNQESDTKLALKNFEKTKRLLGPSSQTLVLKDYAQVLMKQKRYSEYIQHLTAHMQDLGAEDFKALMPQACRWALILLDTTACKDLLTHYKTLREPAARSKKKVTVAEWPAELRFYEYLVDYIENPASKSSLAAIYALDKSYHSILLDWFVFRDSQGLLNDVIRHKGGNAYLGTLSLVAFRNLHDSPFDEDHVDATYLALKKKFPRLFPLARGDVTRIKSKLAKIALHSEPGPARDRALAKMIKDLRVLRSSLGKEIESLSTPIRIEILKIVEDKERLVADTVEASPVPASLSEAGVETYKTEIGKIVTEFSGAADSYLSSTESLKENFESSRKQVLKGIFGKPDLSDFDWPKWSKKLGSSEALAEHFEKLVKDKSYFKALISWELLRVPLNVEASVYQWARAGFILGVSDSYGTRDFLYNSLNESGHSAKKALEIWEDSL